VEESKGEDKEEEDVTEPKHVELKETKGEQITEIEVVKRGNNVSSPFIS